MQDAAIKIAVNHLSDVGPEKAILFGKAIIVNLFQRFKTCPVKYLDSISDEI